MFFSDKIVGGTPAPSAIPYQVSVRSGPDGHSHFCGGTILDKNTVLSAAHCFEGRDVSNHTFYIMAGSKDRNSKQGQIIVIDKLVLNKKQPFSRSTYEFDAVILKLKTGLNFNKNVQPACLPPSSMSNLTNLSCYTSGWGTLKKLLTRSFLPNQLHWVRVPIVSNDQCNATYQDYEIPRSYPSLKISKNMICAGEVDKDSCKGDSGGPLVCRNANDNKAILVGIVSFGFLCGREIPSVYTRVSSILQWIQEHIQQDKYGLDQESGDSHTLPACAKKIWQNGKPCWNFCGHLYCP